MLWLSLIITVILTTLIVLGANWIEKNRKEHPKIYKHRWLLRAIVWITLQGGDF